MLLYVCAAAGSGAFLWTFAEYALHAWWGHLGKGRNDFSREHFAHHRDTTYFAPLHKKLLAASWSLTVIGTLAVLAVGWLYGLAFTGGFTAAWIGYEILHRRIHTHAPWNPYAAWARRHHLHHHFGGIKGNHGVTSPLWDHVFGTFVPTRVVPVPARQVPGVRWLFDATGAVKPQYASHYVLGKRSAATPPPR